MSSMKPLLVALDPGLKLNAYSIIYVIHSLRTSCSELEWVWNSADHCWSRQFQIHVVLITNENLTSLAFWYWCEEYWHLHRCTRWHCTKFSYIWLHNPHGKILAKCKLKITCWKYRNLNMYYIIAVLQFTIRYIHRWTNFIKCIKK